MQVLSLVGQPDCNGILGCSALYLFSTSGPHQEALRRENVESGTGTWPQQPFCRPSAAFAAKSMQPSPVGQAQAGASSSGSPLTDRFRGDFVSWQLTALKSSEHFFNVFIEQQKYVLFVSLSLTRPVTADRMVIPSPSHVPCLHSTHQPSTAVACLIERRCPGRKSRHTVMLTHIRVSPVQTRMLFQFFPEAGCPSGYREIQPGPGFPHAQLREDGPHQPGDRGPGPRRGEHHG